MIVWFNIYTENNKKINPLDIDLNTLSFRSRGEEFDIDLIGWEDIGWGTRSCRRKN